MPSCSSADLIAECREAGWSFDRQRGDHFIMTKAGQPRPIVIPLVGKDVAPYVVSNIRRQLRASRSSQPTGPNAEFPRARKKRS